LEYDTKTEKSKRRNSKILIIKNKQMGFKMKGPSMHSGTASHKSALKSIQSVEARKQAVAAAGQASTSGESSGSPAKADLAYGGTKTWGQGQKDSGGTLNQITREQRAYEKKMKSENPKWNKREDNTWKTTQNKINKHLGSKKVYDTIPDKKTKDKDGVSTMEGLGFDNDKTLSEEAKQAEITKLGIVQDQIDKGKKDKNRDARDKGQQEKGRIKGGGDDKYTGTVVSRTFGKIKESVNKGQLKRRAKNRTKLEKKYIKRTNKGKSTKRLEKRYERKGGDIEDLGTSPAQKRSPAKCPLIAAAVPALVAGAAGAIGKKAAAKYKDESGNKPKNKPTTKKSPAKCPLIAAAVPALVKGIAGGIGKKAGEKVAK
jgi:hypothetical protein